MALLDEVKSLNLRIQNYKSFGKEAQGFETLRPINVLVGRNNSGKSALLDLVELACNFGGILPTMKNKSGEPAIFLSGRISESVLKRVFQEGTIGGPIQGDHRLFGERYIGRQMIVKLEPQNKKSFVRCDIGDMQHAPKSMLEDLAQHITNPLEGRAFRRLAADRDIVPEPDDSRESIGPNGQGFTNAVQRFINKSSLPNDLVEEKFLAELNQVFSPDSSFSNIRVRQHQDNKWEVYLEEVKKGGVALSHSGSGLKTVLLVLAILILVPQIENRSLSNVVLAFEELENNLHPALQRRLVKYICDVALREGCLVLLTTHSSAVIDMLSLAEYAQIIHVTHNSEVSQAKPVTTYVESRGILDDLDVRAGSGILNRAISGVSA